MKAKRFNIIFFLCLAVFGLSLNIATAEDTTTDTTTETSVESAQPDTTAETAEEETTQPVVQEKASPFVRITTNLFGYNFIAKKIASSAIEKALNKSAKGDYKVSIDSFSGVDLKKGIFKGMTIDGSNISVDDELYVSRLYMKTTSDYNYIDYKQRPIVFKTEVPMDYKILITEDDLNKSLLTHTSIVKYISSLLPLVSLTTPKVTLLDNQMKISSALKLPFGKSFKFSISTGVAVKDGKIVFTDTKANNNNDFTQKLIDVMNNQNWLEKLNISLFEGTETNIKIKNITISPKRLCIDGNLVIKEAE